MKIRLEIILTVFCIVAFFSCHNDNTKNKKVIKSKSISQSLNKNNINLNISFLLDLSDRINPEKYSNKSMEYYMRDVAYIKSVSEAFDTHLRRKKVRQMNDKIQVFFDPEPQNKNINSISKSLKYNISRNNVSIELLDEIKKRYSNKPIEIYNYAINDNAYIGSDTWGFFKSKVKALCIEEEYRNILVILTDGYIYHKDYKKQENYLTTYLTPQLVRSLGLTSNNWEAKMKSKKIGYIPATKDLHNLEILVLGINPDKKNPYEEDVIIKYLRDWFNIMDVGRYQIKTAILPSDMDKVITDFILND